MLINDIIKFLLTIIVKTPIYPHFLDFYNKNKDRDKLYSYLYGNILETGAGSLLNKENALKVNKNIRNYKATDYDSWDENFEQQTKSAKKFGLFSEVFYGKLKDKKKLDVICSALDLPFENDTFDCYCSYDVLEHIYDYKTYFSEAQRVLKKDGLIVMGMPYLYREHGGLHHDFHRFSRGKFYEIAKEYNLEIIDIFTRSTFGTTTAIIINQYLIRKILETKNYFFKFILLFISPIVFFTTNTIGFILELFDNDERFASRYNIVMKKL
jgi:ubiquinone/menaquinone biosynthesis C-methylase UbiE